MPAHDDDPGAPGRDGADVDEEDGGTTIAVSALDRLETLVTEPSTTVRIRGIGEHLVAAVAEQRPVNKDAARVLQQLSLTLLRFHDHPSRAAVERAYRAVIAVDAGNVRLVVVMLTKLANGMNLPAKDGHFSVDEAARGVLLRWMCIPIEDSFPEMAQLGPMFADYVNAQALLFNSIEGGELASMHHGTRARFQRALVRPGVFEAYIKAVQKSDPVPRYSTLIGLLLSHCMSFSELLQQHKATFINLFVKDILGTKQMLPPGAIAGFNNLYGLLTLDEFTASIQPVAEKMLLRSPEILLKVLAQAFARITFDSSTLADAYAEPFTGNLKSNNADTRAVALECLRGLAHSAKSTDALIKIVTKVVAVLSSALPSVDHRLAAVTAVLYIAQDSRPHDGAAFAQAALDSLLPVVQREANETAYTLLVAAIGHLTIKLKCAHPNTMSFIETSLRADKTHVRRAAALLMAQNLDGAVLAKMNSIGDILVKTAEKISPSTASEGFAVLLALLKLHGTFDPETSKKGFWDVYLGPSSFVYQEKIYLKLSADDATILVHLLVAALTCLSGAPTVQKSLKHIVTVLVVLGCLGPWQVRKVAREIIPPALDTHPEYTSAMTSALHETMNLRASQPAKYDGLKEQADFATFTSSLLCATSTSTPETLKSRLIYTAVLAHHPQMGRDVWTHAVHSLADKEFVASNAQKLANQLNTEPASLKALRAWAKLAPAEISRAALNFAMDTYESVRHEPLSDSDLGIFHTEEGHTFVDVLVKKEVAPPAMAHRGGRRDVAYSFEDEQWEIQVRKELAAKRAQDEKRKLTREEEALVKAQLESEAVVRSRVANIRAQSILSLSIVDALADALHEHLQNFLPMIIGQLIMPLLGSPLVHHEAGVTFQRMSVCVSQAIQSTGRNIPILWMLVKNSSALPVSWRSASLKDLGATTFTAIHRAVDMFGPLSPASFYFVFLAIEPFLMNQKLLSAEAAEQLLRLTNTHAKQGQSSLLPRKAMMRLYLNLICVAPSLSKLAHTGLVTLSTAAGDTMTADETQVLVDALLNSEVNVRTAALEALENTSAIEGPLGPVLISRIWLCSHDAVEVVVTLAKGLWQQVPNGLPSDYATDQLAFVVHEEAAIRDSATRAVAASIVQHPQTMRDTLARIYDLYRTKAAMPEIQHDEFGRPIKQEFKDPVHLRISIADTIKECTQFMEAGDVLKTLVAFLIADGFADRSESVRVKMLDAALSAVKQHGEKNVGAVLPIVEAYLNQPAPPSEVHDRIRESVVLLVGELAAFLAPTDPKVPGILTKLIATLTTPSEQVQLAVANCLPGLVKSLKDDVGDLMQQMMKQVLDGTKYGDRRGAAYGLAGLVKGKGISALKDFNIMTQLKDAIENKKVMQHRQGALFAYEALSLLLGRLFEPYVIQILPLLLVAFGDGSAEVREAVAEASRVIMSKLSAHCVKLILPSLLVGLSDEQWRTKQGSAELLGSMAFLAPKQLSSSLPTIVPKLTDTLTDSHPKVVAAGKQALQQIGSVIKNPEVQALVPLLLKALVDPNKYTSDALNGLLQTAFVHVVDAPSLALIAPILQRGLKERSTDTKKMAAQIMGNMSLLVDEKDFVPYLPVLIPGVQVILVDPIPEVRKIAARALGTMVTKMGEQSFEGLIPWLLTMLKSETSGVDRSGAAQGLSEVLRGLGVTRLDALLPELVANTSSPSPHVREGCISVLIYLPTNFGDDFISYLDRVIPPVLKGLADESEAVRDVALRAGQVIIANYSRSAVELLLPSLQKGLFDDNWRIRQSSVQLLGDLLYRITGATGKTQLGGSEDEEGIGTEEGRRAVISTLGQDRRDLVLASLYVLRCDISLVVRQASLHVWKTVVSNTPRTLREILPVMMKIIIECLSSPSHDKRTVGARCLGDLVRKQGQRVLPEVMPTLEEGLQSPVATTRQGVCIGLNEIMLTAGKELVVQFLDVILPAVRQAICDQDAMVREPAAEAFDTLFKNVGRTALDEILPALLHNLASPDDATVSAALEGLQLITAVRSNVVFPVLIDQLLHPITTANARALGMLIPSAGKALVKYLSTIMNSLFQMTNPATQARQQVDRAAIDATASILLTTVQDDEAGRLLVMDLIEKANSDKSFERKTACDFLATFCASTRIDYTPYVRSLFRVLLYRLNDAEQDVVSSAWGALDALTRVMKKEQQPDYINEVRRAMQNVVDDAKERTGLIKGFCMPRGIQPLQPMMLQGLLYGSNEVREQAALGMGDLVRFTDADSLKPMVVQMTGALIRIVGDRFNWQVKAAILETLGLLLDKVGITLRPFLPQLQSSFVRALHDTTQDVRIRAASGLGKLIPLQPRVDPLITELLNGAKTCDPSIRDTFLHALFAVLKAGGPGIGAAARTACQTALLGFLGESDDDVRTAAAHCLGVMSKPLSAADVQALFKQLQATDLSAMAKLGSAQALMAILQDNPLALVQPGTADAEQMRKDLATWIVQQIQDDKIPLAQSGVRSLAYALLPTSPLAQEHGEALMAALSSALGDKKPTDVRLIAAVSLKTIAKAHLGLIEPYLPHVVPPLLSAVQEKKIVRLKLAAERALLYSLGLHQNEDVLQRFLALADADTAKTLSDYHRRILSKLARRASGEGPVDAEAEAESDDDQEMGRIFEKKMQM